MSDFNINNIFKQKRSIDDNLTVIDKDWVKSRFVVPNYDLGDLDKINRTSSMADNKFTDTSLGGNLAINSRPQHTRYADIRIPGRLVNRTPVTVMNDSGNYGMGGTYSKTIDDNSQLVYFEFGMAKFNSLANFFTRAIDYTDSVIANTGRKPYAYTAGKFLGAGLMLVAFPLITITVWTVKTLVSVLLGHGSFDYYYLEPNMHNYWGTVNTIATQMATENGILIPELTDSGNEANKIGAKVRINQEDIKTMAKIYPNLINPKTNYIDVYAIATRSQALANQQLLLEYELYKNKKITDTDFLGYVKTSKTTVEKNSEGSGLVNELNSKLSFQKFVDKLLNIPNLYNEPGNDKPKIKNGEPETVTKSDTKIKNDDGTYNVNDNKINKYVESFAKAVDAGVKDGGMHAIFQVDYTGSVSDSFNNSVGEISTGSAIKSVAKKTRDVRFSVGDGNILDGMSKAKGYIQDFLAGGLDSVTFGLSNVVATAFGNSYIDIPKKWEDSSVDLPTVTYTADLVSPYGNPMSKFQNRDLPLAMLLAGVLPLSTGNASYTSPYLCSVYSKGVQNIKLGMITSLTVERGTTNLGFDKNRQPLGIRVSFTVTDFSNLMTAPVNESLFSNNFNVGLDDKTGLSNYISTLMGRDLLTTKYMVPRAKIRASRALMEINKMISPSAAGLSVGEPLSKFFGGLVSDNSLTLKNNI